MKKLALIAALTCLAGSAMATSNPPVPIPSGKSPSYNGGLAFYGATMYYVETSTPTATGVLLASGSGVLFGAQCIGAGASDFGQAFDTAQAGVAVTQKGAALSPALPSQTSQVVAASQQVALMPWIPAGGSLRFTKGLGFVKSNASALACYVYALLDSVTAGPTH